jgi:hypothetical protein
MIRNAKALVIIIKYGILVEDLTDTKSGTIDGGQKARGKHALAPGVKHC